MITKQFLTGDRILTAVAVALFASHSVFGQAAQKLYWNGQFTSRVFRANPDGSNTEEFIGSRLAHPRVVRVDALHGRLYWLDAERPQIRRSNLDGSGIETVIDIS